MKIIKGFQSFTLETDDGKQYDVAELLATLVSKAKPIATPEVAPKKKPAPVIEPKTETVADETKGK